MGDFGGRGNIGVATQFFGILKHDGILKVPQPTRAHVIQDVKDYRAHLKIVFYRERKNATPGEPQFTVCK